MKSAILASALFCIGVASCGGGGSTNDASSPPVHDQSVVSNVDLSSALPPGPDFAGVAFPGVSCGTDSCTETGSVCCNTYETSSSTLTQMCSTSGCGDGGISASCDGPEDCSGTLCCVSINAPKGGQATGEASCVATCTGNAEQANNVTTVTTKLCHNGSDCTGYSGETPVGPLAYSACCSYPGVSYKICAPSLLTALDKSVVCTN